MGGFGFEDGVFGLEPLAVEGGALLGPHGLDEAERLDHLADAGGGFGGEVVAVLLVFAFEPAGAEAEGEAAVADVVNAGGDFGQKRRVAVVDGGDEGREADGFCDGGEAGDGGPAFHEGFVGGAGDGDLHQVIHDGIPGEAVGFGPLGAGGEAGEEVGGGAGEAPGRVVDAEIHAWSPVE